MRPNEDHHNPLAQRVQHAQRIADLEALVTSLYRQAQAAEASLLCGEPWERYHRADAEYSWQHPDTDVVAHYRRARLLLELIRKENK